MALTHTHTQPPRTQGGGGRTRLDVKWATAKSRPPTDRTAISTPPTALEIQVRLPTSALPFQVPEPQALTCAVSITGHPSAASPTHCALHFTLQRFPDIHNSTSPVCPYDNIITYTKTSMEHGGMRQRYTEKRNLSQCHFDYHKSQWDRSQASGARGQRPQVHVHDI